MLLPPRAKQIDGADLPKTANEHDDVEAEAGETAAMAVVVKAIGFSKPSR